MRSPERRSIRAALGRRGTRMILLVALLLVALFMVTDTSYQAAQWLSHGLNDRQKEPPEKPSSTKPENVSSSAPHAMPNTAKLDPPVVLDSSADRCAQVSKTSKVALMFLTMGDMPHAPTWKLWLASAAGKLPKRSIHCTSNEQEISSSCKGPTGMEAAKLSGSALLQAQHLFSLYVHAAPRANLSNMDPLFRDNVIATRIETYWGSMTLVHAARLLLWEAYQDAMNARFVLLSPSDIPLYDPLTFHHQLLSEELSRTSACPATNRDAYRWNGAMASRHLKRQHWRKASQWFMVTREHARLVLDDVHVFQRFEAYCYSGWDPKINKWRNCYGDEHYLPTLFASLGIQQNENCNVWGIASVQWSKKGAHPHSYKVSEVRPELIRKLRSSGDCDGESLISHSQPLYSAVSSPRNSSWTCDGIVTEILPANCPMTARKFPENTAQAVAGMFQDCGGGNNLRMFDPIFCSIGSTSA